MTYGIMLLDGLAGASCAGSSSTLRGRGGLLIRRVARLTSSPSGTYRATTANQGLVSRICYLSGAEPARLPPRLTRPRCRPGTFFSRFVDWP